MLQSYVSSRLGCNPSMDRDELILCAKFFNHMKRKVLELQAVPTQIKAWNLEGALKERLDQHGLIKIIIR